MKTRLMLVDDHRMFREALRLPLAAEADMEIVAEAGSGAEALAVAAACRPDVVVLDVALPDMSGIEVAGRLLAAEPQLRLVALSGYADRLFVAEMLKAGVRAYVVKSAGADELVRAIRAAVEGHVFLSPEVTGVALGQGNRSSEDVAPPVSVLGPREREVLRLLAGGMRSVAIADALGISPATVDVHRRNIKRKLGLDTVAALTRYAIREGLVLA